MERARISESFSISVSEKGEDSSSSLTTPKVMELNLIGSVGGEVVEKVASSPVKVMLSSPEPEQQQRVFSCKFCQRKLYSSQALGGHQNAHKMERMLAKRGGRGSGCGAAHINEGSGVQYPYHHHIMHRYPMTAGLFGGSPSLGIQVHSSMVLKPYIGEAGPGIYGRHGREWPAITNYLQSSIGRLLGKEFYTGRMAQTSGFDEVAATTTASTPIGRYQWICRNGNGGSDGGGGDLSSKSRNQLDVNGDEPMLDLSLKL